MWNPQRDRGKVRYEHRIVPQSEIERIDIEPSVTYTADVGFHSMLLGYMTQVLTAIANPNLDMDARDDWLDFVADTLTSSVEWVAEKHGDEWFFRVLRENPTSGDSKKRFLNLLKATLRLLDIHGMLVPSRPEPTPWKGDLDILFEDEDEEVYEGSGE